MKKVTGAVLVLAIVSLLFSSMPGYARGFGGFRGGWGWWPWAVGGAVVGATLAAPYYYPYYQHYPARPVVVQTPPAVYVQPRQQQAYYWYFCQNPQGYYPYVPSCSSGWVKVMPR